MYQLNSDIYYGNHQRMLSCDDAIGVECVKAAQARRDDGSAMYDNGEPSMFQIETTPTSRLGLGVTALLCLSCQWASALIPSLSPTRSIFLPFVLLDDGHLYGHDRLPSPSPFISSIQEAHCL